MARPDLTIADPAGADAPGQVAYENAQSRTLLVQLDEAFSRAEADDQVRVVILAARGQNFSAGHDLGSEAALLERQPGPAQHPTFRSHGATVPAIAERTYRQEWHFFFENTCRWRDLRKITIAQVQGNAISAGLMLIWACDLIVAADDAKFSDVVGVRMGMPGVEYYAHPWEFGPRKAKELLLTGDSLDADEAYRLGMVSKVFPRDELEDKTLEFARRIAEQPRMAALLIKDSVMRPTMRWDSPRRCARVSHPRTRACTLGRAQREQVSGGPAARRSRLAHARSTQAGASRYALTE